MSGIAPDTRLLDEPVPRALLKLALPVLASQALRLAFQWVDAVWVRALGVQATAAVTTSVFVLWCVYALHDVFGAGLSAYVSQLVGAGERERAGAAVGKALGASALLGTGAALLGQVAARPVFALMDPAGSVVEAGATYLRIVLLGAPFLMCALTCEAAMRASGDTRTPMIVDACSITLNVVLAPLLIYGHGPVPRFGVAGAAWATVLSQMVMLAWYVLLWVRRHPSLPLARHAPDRPVSILGLARVGVPAALIGILFSVVYMAFVRAASPLGSAAVAIIGVANRIEALQFILSVSVGLAGSSLLGQALGAGRGQRALDVLHTAQRWGLVMSVVLTVVLFAFPGPLLLLFTRDTALHAIGVPYMRVLSMAVIATGVEIVTAESIMGSGHTREISLIFTVFSLVRIPLAFMVPHWQWRGQAVGIMGIAWLITVTCIARSALMLAWAARGTWRRGLARELRGSTSKVAGGEGA